MNIYNLIDHIQQFKCPKDEGALKFISKKLQNPNENNQRLYCEYCVQNAQEFIHVSQLHSLYEIEKKSMFDTAKCKAQLKELEISFRKELFQLSKGLDEYNEWHFLLTNHSNNINQLTLQKLNDLSIKLSNLEPQKEHSKKVLLDQYDQLACKLQELINIINQQKLSMIQISNTRKYNSEKVNQILYYEDKLITANLENQIMIWEQDQQQKYYFITKIIETNNRIQQLSKYSEGIIACFPDNAVMYNLKQYLLDIKNQQQDPKIVQTTVSAFSEQTSLVIHNKDLLITGGDMIKVFKLNENKWTLLQKIFEESNIKQLAQNDSLNLVISAGLVLNVWKFDDNQKLSLYQQLQKSNCFILRVQFGEDQLISSDANYQVVVYQMHNNYYQKVQQLENVSHGLNLSIGQYLCFGNQVFKFNKESKQWVIYRILKCFGKELYSLENKDNLIVGCSDSILVFEL